MANKRISQLPAAASPLAGGTLLPVELTTGDTKRATLQQMRSFVSVQDYGAVGNGIADDTAAIQAAFTANPGKTILFPTGVYVITATLSAPANTTISGYGATLSCTTSQFTALTFVNGGACFGLTITGPASGTYNVNGIGIACSGTNNHPAAPTYVTGPRIEDCTISNFGYAGVMLSYIKKAEIRNSRISGVGYAGIGGVSCEDVIVDGNTIENVAPGSAGGDAYGVFIDRNNGLAETSDPRSYRCAITNNIVKNVTATGGNGQGIDTHAGVDFLIDGNVVSGCQSGIFVTSSSIAALGQQLGAIRCVVSNNTVDGTGLVGYGILLNGANNAGTFIDATRDCVISGNTVTGFGNPGDATIGAIHLQFTKDVTVIGNVVKNSRCNCINLNGLNNGLNISGNILVDPWDNSYTTPNCIRVGANDNRGYIGNNVFRFENSALGTYVAVNAVRIESGLTGLDLDFERSNFVGISATRLTFSPLTTTGVRYTGLANASGSGTISVNSGVGDGITDVTFSKRFPYTPTVRVMLRRPFNQGGKFPILGIDTSVAISATGFRIYALPYDGATWSASGSLSFDWTAE